MRDTTLALLLGMTLAVSGCASHKGSSATFSEVPSVSNHSAAGAGEEIIVTADNRLFGKVAKLNAEGRFVVLTFPIGHLPALQQHLNVYRLGLKVGEVRVTGPQLDDSVVGDIFAGDAQPGDEVRAQ